MVLRPFAVSFLVLFFRQLFLLQIVLKLAYSDDVKQGEEGEDEKGEGCDPEFRQNVEKCLHALKGFHVMTRHKTLILGDWDRTNFICMFELMHFVGVCLSSLYALTPQSRRWRSLCGFQSVDPDLLMQYGQAVCRNKDVLHENAECLNSSQDVLESCVYTYQSRVPSRLTTGMWKEPQYSSQCSFHAYAEHCYEKRMFGRCSIDLYYAHLDILKSTRPPKCSWQDVDLLKRRYRQTESYIVYYNSSAWTPCYVTLSLIGSIVVSLLWTLGSLGVG